MASIHIKLRKSTVKDKPGSIYYQIIHRRKLVKLTTSVKLYPEEWDFKNERIHLNGNNLSRLLSSQKTIDIGVLILNDIIKRKDQSKELYSVDDIVHTYNSHDYDKEDFFIYMKGRIRKLEEENALGTALNYQRAYQSFASFISCQYLPFFALTEQLVADYQEWLFQRSLKRNSSSFYMRILRAVFNSAVLENLAPQRNPFIKVYTGVDVSQKRAVDNRVIRELKELDLKSMPSLLFARDLFFFSLYCRGMAFVDMAYLQKSDIRNGFLSYVRRKTSVRLTIRIEPYLEEIISKYRDKNPESSYFFPIISAKDKKEAYKDYQNGLNYYNKLLKRLSMMLRDEPPLSSYTSRHTWATTARDGNIPLSVISAGMGHSSENVTRIYLSSLDNSVVDRANHNVISMLEGATT